MDFYLASSWFKKDAKEFKKLVPKNNKKIAFIQNAMDYSEDHKKVNKQKMRTLKKFKEFKLKTEIINLRQYFGKPKALRKKMQSFGAIYVSGGNTFVLRQAMKLSGLDKILINFSKKKNFLYSGGSAGTCIVAPSLRGIEFADSPKLNIYHTKLLWDGLGLINYMPVPHYKTRNKKWKRKIDRTVEYYTKNKLLFKTIKNGEVIIIKNGKEKICKE